MIERIRVCTAQAVGAILRLLGRPGFNDNAEPPVTPANEPCGACGHPRRDHSMGGTCMLPHCFCQRD